MLIAHIGSYDEATICETVRGVAARVFSDFGITEQAVDEAIRHFRSLPPKLRSVHASVQVGVDFLNQLRVQQARGLIHVVPATAPEHVNHAPRLPFAWVESWPFIVGALAVVGAIAYGVAAGVL